MRGVVQRRVAAEVPEAAVVDGFAFTGRAGQRAVGGEHAGAAVDDEPEVITMFLLPGCLGPGAGLYLGPGDGEREAVDNAGHRVLGDGEGAVREEFAVQEEADDLPGGYVERGAHLLDAEAVMVDLPQDPDL
jgi:hypothetical protein